MAIIQVVKVPGKRGGYRVQIQHRPVMEDMFETLSHFMVFEDKDEAEFLKVRISAKLRAEDPHHHNPFGQLSLDHWLWSASQASPFGFMHKEPVAVETYRERTRF